MIFETPDQYRNHSPLDEAWLTHCSVVVLQRLGDMAAVEITRDDKSWDGLMAPLDATEACRRLEEIHAATQNVDWLAQPASLVRTGYAVVVIFPRSARFSPSTPKDLASVVSLLKIAIQAARLVMNIRRECVIQLGLAPSLFTVDSSGVYLRGFAFAYSDIKEIDELQPYIAPELYRGESSTNQLSDIYSLGIVFAEWFTGSHPISLANDQSWRQAHLTLYPSLVNARNAAVPKQLGEVLHRAMAKDPVDRYQTVCSLLSDLEQCLHLLEHQGRLEAFELGRADPPLLARGRARAMVGRNRESQILKHALSAVGDEKGFEKILVTGQAGVGKSFLISSLLSQLGDWNVGTGKSDLLQRGTPLAPWSQIFRALISQVLGWDVQVLDRLKNRLSCKLGNQARVLTDLVPEAEMLLGPTDPLVPLPADQALARVNRCLVNALTCFSIEKPLALFLDDVQWIDTASASLLTSLCEAQPARVLVLLASRSEGKTDDVENTATCSAYGSSPSAQNILKLSPLSVEAVAELLERELRAEASDALSLARVLHSKTLGNPFFIKQIFSTLVDEGKITFDPLQRKWGWSTGDLDGLAYADNVLSLMLERMGRLPSRQRKLLGLMGCVGSWCPKSLVARLSGISPDELEHSISQLVSFGLIRLGNEGIEFPHDRLLEAAYALTPDAIKAREHARIAVEMIMLWGENLEEHCFAIASQIEKALKDIPVPLAEMAIRPLVLAANRAKSSAAFTQAADFMSLARRLHHPDRWLTHNHETQEIFRLCAECELLKGDLAEAESLLDTCLSNAWQPVDKARAYGLKANLHELRSDYEGSVSAVLDGLALLGIVLERNPTSTDMDEAYNRIRSLIDGRPIQSLGDLPPNSDENISEALRLLSALIPTFFVDPNLTFTHLAKMVELTLVHGATAQCGHGFAWFGVKIGERYDAYEEGAAFAEAGLSLTQSHGTDFEMAGVLVAYDQIAPWTMAMSTAIQHARQAQTIGIASGNVPMACYASNHLASDLIFTGAPLPTVIAEIKHGLGIIETYSYIDIERILRAQEFFLDDLMHGFGEASLVAAMNKRFPLMDEHTASKTTLFLAYLYIAMAAYHFGSYQIAAEALDRIAPLTWACPAHINLSDFYLYGCLARLELGSAAKESGECFVQQSLARFEVWTRLNPATFRHKALLIKGVLARMQGDDLVAIRHFDQAGIAAAAGGFIHEQALAHELLARTCESNGLVSGAHHHWRVARDCYQLWGAAAKAKAVTLSHPFLMTFDSERSVEKARDSDLEIGIKAAQALSQEMLHDRLVQTLMQHLMTHAGASYGLLMTVEEGRMAPAASCRLEQGNLQVDLALEQMEQDAPMSLLLTGMRTKRLIVVQDATIDCPDAFRQDLRERGARSALCLPLIRQGSLIGLVYLENNLMGDVFGQNRISMLEILAAQAAVSLETARLYSRLMQANQAHAQTEAELRASKAELARSSQLAVMGELSAAIAHEISQPLLAIASNASASLKWLKRDQPNLDGVAQGLEDIRSDGRRAANIIQALRSLAKQQPPALVETDVTGLIDEVLRLMMNEIRHSKVELTLSLSPAVIVMADRTQIQQVLYNLLNNALEAMLEQNANERRLGISTCVVDSLLQVAVDDNGPGIGDQAEKVFDAFYTTKGSGLGMGLAICRSVMRAHGGVLEASRSPMGGCRMTFSLPLAVRSAEDSSIASNA